MLVAAISDFEWTIPRDKTKSVSNEFVVQITL